MNRDAPLGIMTAMPEEAEAVLQALDAAGDGVSIEHREHGRRTFHLAELHGRPVIVAVSRCGKVAAATTATEMIIRHDASALIFAGVAGGLAGDVHIGDIVVATDLMQHDLDPRPLWPRHVVPLLERGAFPVDVPLSDALAEAAASFLAHDLDPALETHGPGHRPAKAHRGRIVSGDQFIHEPGHAAAIRELVPDALCVEMEGAAAAQVAFEYGVPVAVIRAISDRADGDASEHFTASLGSFAAGYAAGVLKRAMPALDPAERR